MHDLNNLRKSALAISEEIIQLILKRRPIVEKIQSLKEKKESLQNFDPARELLVFNSLIDLESLSLKEVFAISLLVESQAGGELQYPQWSSGVHLVAKPNNITEQINPILLASTFKTSYDALPLNIEYKELLLSTLNR